jgi:hypothetical protein
MVSITFSFFFIDLGTLYLVCLHCNRSSEQITAFGSQFAIWFRRCAHIEQH